MVLSSDPGLRKMQWEWMDRVGRWKLRWFRKRCPAEVWMSQGSGGRLLQNWLAV